MEDNTRSIDGLGSQPTDPEQGSFESSPKEKNQGGENKIKTESGLTPEEREKVKESNAEFQETIVPAIQVKSKRGGRRPGSGRPRKETYLQKHTVASRKQSVAMQMRIVRQTPQLLNAQIALAKGVSYLIRVEKIAGKPRSTVVKDKMEILAYFDGLIEDTDERVYFHITTDKPNLQAIQDLMDRAYGKARQTVGLDGGADGKPITIESYERAKRALLGTGAVV